MRLGIISDTHGHAELTRPAVRLFESLEVEAVLHAGDIGSVEVVELFSPWPTHFVFGNCDEDHAALRAAIEAAGQTCHGDFGDFKLEGVRIALLHSHDRRRFRQCCDSGAYRLVCYGHTHVAAIDQRGETLVVNPGAIYRASPHSVAIVDLPEVKATIIEV
ncbi:MAG: YfcE family phosphodiesterase [Pirellulales bacterium]